MAVRPDGRANPNQLIISRETERDLARLRETLVQAHVGDSLVIGFQLTYSGRFCRPNDKVKLEPRIAFRHPILDKKFGISSDAPVLSDSEVERLVESFIEAAKIAANVGA